MPTQKEPPLVEQKEPLAKRKGTDKESKESKQIALDWLQAKLDRQIADTTIRERLVMWSCITVSLWLIFVVIEICSQPELSSEVLIALLTTTTLNILGLSYIVLKGYFNKE